MWGPTQNLDTHKPSNRQASKVYMEIINIIVPDLFNSIVAYWTQADDKQNMYIL